MKNPANTPPRRRTTTRGSSSPSVSPPNDRYRLRSHTRRNQSPPTPASSNSRSEPEDLRVSNDNLSEDEDSLNSSPAREMNQRLEALVAENTILQAQAAQSQARASRAQGELTIVKRRINEVVEALKVASTCIICSSIMRRPFTVECGHSFCAPCLRQWFRLKLAEKLNRIPYLLRCSGDTYNCRVTPQHNDHLAYLLAVLAHYRLHSARRLLSYPCPTCRAVVTVAPIQSITTSTLISEAEIALRVWHSEDNTTNEGGVVSSGYFNGLFFNVDLTFNRPPLPRSRILV